MAKNAQDASDSIPRQRYYPPMSSHTRQLYSTSSSSSSEPVPQQSSIPPQGTLYIPTQGGAAVKLRKQHQSLNSQQKLNSKRSLIRDQDALFSASKALTTTTTTSSITTIPTGDLLQVQKAAQETPILHSTCQENETVSLSKKSKKKKSSKKKDAQDTTRESTGTNGGEMVSAPPQSSSRFNRDRLLIRIDLKRIQKEESMTIGLRDSFETLQHLTLNKRH